MSNEDPRMEWRKQRLVKKSLVAILDSSVEDSRGQHCQGSIFF